MKNYQQTLIPSFNLFSGILICTICLLMASCKQKQAATENITTVSQATTTDSALCHVPMPKRLASNDTKQSLDLKTGSATTEGMVWIPAGTFNMGADNNQAREDEYPKHKVSVEASGWMYRR